MIEFDEDWDSQPQEVAPLEPAYNPAFGWLGSNPNVELLKGSPLARVDGTTDAGIGGLGRALQSSNTERILIPDAVSPGQNFIAVVAFENLVANTNGIILAGKFFWSLAHGFYFRSITNVNTLEIIGSSTTAPQLTVTGVGAADGQLKVLALEYAGTTVRVWLNGKYCGSVTIVAAGAWPDGLAIGNYAGTTYNYSVPNRRFYGAAIVTSGDPQQLSLNPWQIFAPQSIWVPVSAGGASTITATVSVSAAIQAARNATASVNAAIQASQSASASVNAAVAQARTVQAALDAAVLQARSTTASVDAAVQRALTNTSSVDGVIQAASAASSSVNAAVKAGQSATTSVNAYVQAGAGLVATIDAYIQAGNSKVATVDTVIQQARTGNATIDAVVSRALSASASLAAAVLEHRSATASVNAYIQAGTTLGAGIEAAIQAQQSASASIGAAVSVARSASASVAAMIAVYRTVGAMTSAAIRAGMSATASLGAYVYSDDIPPVLGSLAGSVRRAGAIRPAAVQTGARPAQVQRGRR